MAEAGPLDRKSALVLFAEVATVLNSNKSLAWHLAGDSIREAYNHFDQPETIKFLEGCWLRVITNMTQFSPGKIGPIEKKIIEDSLHISAKLVVELLPDHPWALLILGRIFDSKIPFYFGLKSSYQLATGYPAVRMAVAKKFAELRGMEKVVQTLRSDSFWCGCDTLRCILGIVNAFETTASFEDRTRQDLAVVIMEKMVNLPDELVKKENTDIVSSVIQNISILVSLLSLKDIFQERFYVFWFDCIMRYINSSSIVVKLFGWEQLADIIAEVRSERPFSTSYTVEGAGTPFVNGQYLVDPNTVGKEVVQYVKAANHETNTPVLTLFRCNMRNSKSKWWFISQADAEKPGSEKDIDYYVHRSTVDEEREPSLTNWTNSHPGMAFHGKSPCPTLRRGEDVIGGDNDQRLDRKLVQWCIAGDVLSQVFNASMHREIINRSIKLLQFLQEYNALSDAKLKEIWICAIKSREKDISDEIFSIFVQLLASSSPAMFDAVLGFATETLKASEDGFLKVASFLEKFSLEDFKTTNFVRSPSMVGKLLSLIWEVYSDKRYPTTSGLNFIQELLSFCFKQKGGLDIVVQKVRDCKSILDQIAAKSEFADGDEEITSQILQKLYFLVSKTGNHDIDAWESEALNMINTLVAEVSRYAVKNRFQADRAKYISELHLRLQILRKFYSITICQEIDTIIQLWDKISLSPEEMDEFCSFLKGEGLHDSIFTKEDVLLIFDRIFCSEKIDWSIAGEKTFDCFRSFFQVLESWSAYLVGHELPPKRGLSSLWSMCFSTKEGKIGHAAIELLLLAYESLLIYNSSALSDFVQTVFDKLKEFSSTESGELDVMDVIRSSRCIDILTQGLNKFGCGKAIAHAAKGMSGRVSFSVYYKRLNYSTHIDSLRYDKSSDGFVKLEMHPLHTIKLLKTKIIENAHLPASTSITFDNAPRNLSDHAHISELGELDGTEIVVSYQTNYTHRMYDDDMYDSYYAGGRQNASNFGQMVIDDLSKFDALLSLCQNTNSPQLVEKVWNFLMLLPSQMNMVEMIRNMAIQNDPDFASDYQGAESWRDILVDASQVRSTYLLQILDYLLRPAPEARDLRAGAKSFLLSFGNSEGLSTVLDTLIQLPETDDVVNYQSMVTCLHIMYSLAFSSSRLADSDDIDDEDNFELDIVEQSVLKLTTLNEKDVSRLIDKLLFIARGAAAREDSNVVHDALVIISLVIRSPEAASQLMRKEYTRELLTSVLRNKSKKLREIAANFAVQIGRVQPDVFQWLFQELHVLTEDDECCSDLFFAMVTLISTMDSHTSKDILQQLSVFLLEKLIEYPAKRSPLNNERYTLLGYLELLEQILLISPEMVLKTKFGDSFLHVFVKEFLLVMPDDPNAESAVCDTTATRSVGFRVLSRLLEHANDYDLLLNDLERLTRLASKQMHYYWGMQVSFDIKRPDIDFIGLKNQGCTCYMNSLLQVLYMCPRFRDAILSTPLREAHRTTLWHYDNTELVDKTVMFEWQNNEWRSGKIVGYDPDSRNHRVQYERLDGTLDEIVAFNIHEGRIHRETGRAKLVLENVENAAEVLNEREDAALRVMEQLQRTFAFLKWSKKKYFDPRPFVDACKTLNLSFNVYHQNDASEFCDQLLDRVETASKGKHTNIDMWEDIFLKSIFGGKMLTQKIPQDCPAFVKDKDSCGLWQSPRLENYLKVEVQIRGKESVAESLEGLVQGELMDGDNKIQCDVCKEKKAAVMRTCIGSLPNVLLLHLKRFDLDFQTFETVKLNSKMEFPMTINMLKYTKDGIDNKEEEGETITIKEENNVDPADYEYELQGILVHAGVAQGGHYYSFVRSYDDPNQWFKFDDEDVTPFTTDQIPEQCFGGPYSNNGSTNSSYDDDLRTANALMLLYNKKKVSCESPIASPQGKDVAAIPKDLITGYQAFEREVMESNLQHNLTCFLVDPELHCFVRSLISNTVKSQKAHSQEGLVERVVQFGISFLLNVLLHFRERSAIKDYVNVLKDAFEAFPATAYQFVNTLLSPSLCSWLNDYMLSCTDPLARASFVQLVVNAIQVMAPKDVTAVTAAFATTTRHTHAGGIDEIEWTPAELCARLVQRTFDLVFKSANHVRTADEVFALVRDLSGIPSICHSFRHHNIISLLSYYIMPDAVPPHIKGIYDKHVQPAKNGMRPDYSHLLQNVFEAIAALIGVPQVRKVNLLKEKSYWESELVPEAKDAFKKIFDECSRGDSMDQIDVQQYMDKVLATSGIKASQTMIRNVMDRMSAQSNQRVYLDGFLTYHTENAMVNPKNVWRDLHAFGFRNDLSRAPQKNKKHLPVAVVPARSDDSSSDEEDALEYSRIESRDTSETISEAGPLELRDICRHCLQNIAFYESGMIYSPAAARAIAQRVCTNDEAASATLIQQALNKLYMVGSDYTWNHLMMSSINDFLRLLLTINDGLQSTRFINILLGSQFGLANVIAVEKERMHSGTHDFSRSFLLDRYLNFVQDLLLEPGAKELLHSLAEEYDHVRLMRGLLKLNPSLSLTYDEEMRVCNSTVVLSNAGTAEVNGEYKFVGFKANAGSYERYTTYNGKESRFVLYKCSLRNGGYQWFLSITPPDQEPGTNQDIDFYFTHSKHGDYLPPLTWYCLQNASYGVDPAPKIDIVLAGGDSCGIGDDHLPQQTYDSDSDLEDSEAVVGDNSFTDYDVDPDP